MEGSVEKLRKKGQSCLNAVNVQAKEIPVESSYKTNSTAGSRRQEDCKQSGVEISPAISETEKGNRRAKPMTRPETSKDYQKSKFEEEQFRETTR